MVGETNTELNNRLFLTVFYNSSIILYSTYRRVKTHKKSQRQNFYSQKDPQICTDCENSQRVVTLISVARRRRRESKGGANSDDPSSLHDRIPPAATAVELELVLISRDR